MNKAQLIQQILSQVNAHAVGKKADGDLFFRLAFMSENDLRNLCKTLTVSCH